MGLFKKRSTEEDHTKNSIEADSALLYALVGRDDMNIKKAMNIPTFAGCVSKICETISIIPINLYEKTGEAVEQVDDPRVSLINDDTHDTLTGSEFKRAIVFDYLTNKGGYAYIHRVGTKIKSIHYVDVMDIGFMTNTDPIFKDYDILCGGKKYKPYEFLKVLRRTKNGYEGMSIISENDEALATAYNSLIFENIQVKRGGKKRGFLENEKPLSEPALKELQENFRKMYNDMEERTIALNAGTSFKEASSTSVEMQLNENKKSNAIEICKLFGMPLSILTGNATEQDKISYIQFCIAPILNEICSAFNRDLLFESEKKERFFEADITEFTKGDIKTRYDAYATAYKTGFMQINDIRRRENMPGLDMPFVKMGLQDVLYDPESGTIFTPNTGRGYNIKDAMEGKVAFDSEGKPVDTSAGKQSEPDKNNSSSKPGKETPDEDSNKG